MVFARSKARWLCAMVPTLVLLTGPAEQARPNDTASAQSGADSSAPPRTNPPRTNPPQANEVERTTPLTAKPRATPREDLSADAKRDIREKVRQGKLNACVTGSVVDATSREPVLVFRNECDMQVNVTVCVRAQGEPKTYFLQFLAPKSQGRQRLWLKDGQTFEYRYNSCENPYCTAPRPEC